MVLHVETAETVDELSRVPTDRRVALRLLWLLDDPHAPLDEIGRVISADPALSARVLSVANSPFYGAPGHVTTIARAVGLLGTTTVRTFATTAALELFSCGHASAPDRFWVHSVTAGVAAAAVADQAGASAAEALTTAVMHDLGTVLLHARDPRRYDELTRATASEPDDVRVAAERRAFGIDHAALGARVLAQMSLPRVVTEAIAAHHGPDDSSSPLTRILVVANRVANALDDEAPDGNGVAPALEALGVDPAFEERLLRRTAADRRALLSFLANFLDARAGR
jgi:putative nucleotidyltransferase with HDIG domain